jgi:hypothetical protein
MKNQKIIISIPLLSVFIFVSFTLLKYPKRINKQSCFSMIWNDRITKKSWIYLNQDEQKVYKKNSDITDGDIFGMPKNSWDAIYTDAFTNEKFSTSAKTNASFKFVTLGYKIEDQKKEVGFDFIVLNKNKKKEEPFIFKISNNSQKENPETSGILREVGFVLDNWPQYWGNEKKWTGGLHSFKDNYQIEKLDRLIVKFKFRLVDYNKPLYDEMVQKKWLGSYATCDFRFNEFDENGKLVNSFLLGVVFSNPLNVDFNGNNNDDILFGSIKTENKSTYRMLLLHGNKVGIKEINTVTSQNNFKTVEIDFEPLVEKYFNINKKHKNIVTGLDIYSATRASDFTYEIQDLRMTGCIQ